MPLKAILNKPLLWVLVGALLTALTLVFPILGALQWLSMIPIFLGLFRLCEDPAFRARRAYGYGFLTVYVYYLVLYHWFCDLYPLDFAGLDAFSSAVVVAVACLGLPLLQAIPGGLIFLCYRAIHKTGIFKKAPILRPVAFSALWVIFEWSSTLHWSGVPWGRLALGQIELLPMLQSASLFGSYFVSFLLLLVNGLCAYAIYWRKKALPAGLLAAALLSSNLLFGEIMLRVKPVEDDRVTVAVIQANLNSHEKWGNSASYAITKHAELTAKAAGEGAELVVWPETALPVDLEYRWEIKEEISEIARTNGVSIVVGAFHVNEEKEEFNALFWVDPDGSFSEQVYAKRHLVPFGEYVPMRDVIVTLIPPLAEISMLEEDLTPGRDSALFESEWGRIGSLICFDSIYEQLTLDSVRDGAELMLISSNDSWFMDSAAVYQHQAQAQLRAIESGRSFVRSANTGISSVITARGELLALIDPLTEGYAVSSVPTHSGATLYTAVGNLWVYLCIAFALLLWGMGAILQKRRQE